MRKLFFILLAFAFTFTGCSDDDHFDMDNYIYEHYLKPYQKYLQSFKIKDTTGLVLTNFGRIQGDPEFVFFSGIRNKRLWFGKFNEASREQVYEWNSPEPLQQYRDKYLADDSIQSIEIKYAVIDGPVTKIGDTYIFILYSGSNFVYSTPFTTDFYDLYFLTGEQAVKHEGPEICTEIQTWYPGTILTKGFPWCCFSSTGEKLYSFHEGVQAGIPISVEECINANLSGLKRVNLKTGEIKWQTGQLYKDLSDNSQAFIYKDSAINTVWTFKVLLMDGLKLKATRIFTVDIETGQIKYL